MNEQRKPGGIEWTRLYGRKGYTANPVKGCLHQCQWLMPDGMIAICYAKEVAEGVARGAYPNGFERLSFHPDELTNIERHKTPAGIFIDSMSDLFGAKVEREWILRVLGTIGKCPQHIFFSLTKNAVRLKEFELPENLWCGISSPPTYMFGKLLSHEQQHTLFSTWIRCLANSSAVVKWISFEPLAIDVTDTLADYKGSFQWAVIGAASNRGCYHQPDNVIFANTQAFLDKMGCATFYKGNLDHHLAESIGGRWREDFPPAPKQLHQAQMI